MNPSFSAAPCEPHLFPFVRRALSVLYSPVLDADDGGRAAADAYLVRFQSRNPRRKRDSMATRCRAHAANSDAGLLSDDDEKDFVGYGENVDGDVSLTVGSTWLTCLALLSSKSTGPAERAFAAQTIARRLRRMRLSDAVDLEFEPGLSSCFRHSQRDLYEFTKRMGWNEVFRSLLFRSMVEERIDISSSAVGTLVMDATSGLCLACCSRREEEGNRATYLALASATAAAALRVRYCPSISPDRLGGGNSTPPLVEILARSLQSAARFLGPGAHRDLGRSIAETSGELVDLVLGSPSIRGAGRGLSLDPRRIMAAAGELRNSITGIGSAAVVASSAGAGADSLLLCAGKWAGAVPLTPEVLDLLQVPLRKALGGVCPQNTPAHSFLLAVYENAITSRDEVAASLLGMTEENSNGRRRKGRAKKRHEQRKKAVNLQVDLSQGGSFSVDKEMCARKEAAVAVSALAWCGDGGLLSSLQQILVVADQDVVSEIEGEGIVGVAAAGVAAVLPFLLEGGGRATQQHYQHQQGEMVELFSAHLKALCELCTSKNRSVRALAYDALLALHNGTVKAWRRSKQPTVIVSKEEREMAEMAVLGVYQCVMALATACAYPPDYFLHLSVDADVGLEIERNDVRDMLRSTTVPEEEMDDSHPALLVFENVLVACNDAIHCATDNNRLPPEAAVHALSALAKPLNTLGRRLTTNRSVRCISIALEALSSCCRGIVCRVDVTPVNIAELLPVGRLVGLATAALAPMFSALCGAGVPGEVREAAARTINLMVHAALRSVLVLPELCAASSLGESQYDIRGAMRAPGGEDHCSCIALMRLANESETLLRTMSDSYCDPLSPITAQGSSARGLVEDLCNAVTELTRRERDRGFVHHGTGVLPCSRRILSGKVACVVALGAIKWGDRDAAGISSVLQGLVGGPAAQAAGLMENDVETTITGERRLYLWCETVYDMAAFPGEVTDWFFQPGENVETFSRIVHRVAAECDRGYKHHLSDVDEITQWGRLRGAIVSFFKACIQKGLPPIISDALVALTVSECDAVLYHFNHVVRPHSIIFFETAVGEEMLPAGAFLHVLASFLDRATSVNDSFLRRREVVKILRSSMGSFAAAVTTDPSFPDSETFQDPRPFLLEAWFCVVRAVALTYSNAVDRLSDDAETTDLLGTSGCIVVQLLMQKRPARDGAPDVCSCGPSLDGPQTLAMLDFLEAALSLGPAFAEAVGGGIRQSLALDLGGSEVIENNAMVGAVVLGAITFRSLSGALPPWAIEGVPGLLSSLFVALGKNGKWFQRAIALALEVRMPAQGEGFGRVPPGGKLGGPLLESMGDKVCTQFLKKVVEAVGKNSNEGWRGLKMAMKQLCGGKKKMSEFNLKPSYTRWDCDRL